MSSKKEYRCLGRNVNLRRCGRKSSKRFCEDHKLQPLKYTVSLITIIASIITIYTCVPQAKDFEQKVNAEQIIEEIDKFNFADSISIQEGRELIRHLGLTIGEVSMENKYLTGFTNNIQINIHLGHHEFENKYGIYIKEDEREYPVLVMPQ